MKTYWANLSERDRLVIIIGAAICFVYLFYLLIYAPLIHSVDFKSRQLVEKKETLIWMRGQAKVKHSPRKTDSNLLSVLSNELKHAPFAQFPYQLQQAGEAHVQLSFEQVPYAPFLMWLRKLNQQYTMVVTELAVVRGQTSGVVKLRVVVANQEKSI